MHGIRASRRAPSGTHRAHPAESEAPGRKRATRPRRSDARTCAEREAIILRLLPLVRRVAFELRERLPQHIDVDDLAGAGVLGLLEAVKRFDTRRHTKIETYARYRIRGAILDSLRDLDPASRDLRRKSKNAESVYRSLQSRLGRAVEDEELASAMGMSLENWYESAREMQILGLEWMRPQQFPEPSPTDEVNLPDENCESSFDQCYRREQKELIARAANMLPERERDVIALYYRGEKTMGEIGRIMEIDESRVSQIHSAAISRLRTKVRRLLSERAIPFPAFCAASTAGAGTSCRSTI